MKKTLLLGALSLLSMLHGQKPSLALTRKAAASNASLVQLDSLITLQQKGQVAGYDTLLYVYHNRDPRDPYQIDQNSYFLHGGSKDNRDKVETVKQAFVDSTVYTQTSSIWNTSLGVWHNSFREVSTIDGDRRIVRRTTSGWDGLQGEWEPYKLYRTHYNSEGYVSLEEELAWDEAQKNWIPLLKSTYTYESMGRLIKKETYKAGLHGWILVGRQVNVLDTQGKVLPDSTYELQGDVALHRATAYIYDAQGRLSKETKYNTAFTDTLAFIIAYNYMYSSAGDTLTKVSMRRSGDTLVPSSKWVMELRFDELQQETRYFWNGDDSEWLPMVRTVYEYNIGSNPSYQTYLWDDAADVWESNVFEKYYFSQVVVGIQDAHLEMSSFVYPNPAKDKIQLNVPKLENYTIYDAQGQYVLQGHTQEVDVQALHSGAYLFKIYAGAQVYSQRWVKID